MKKKLVRTVIVRQYDYNKMAKYAVPWLYSYSEFTPITIKELEQQHIMNILSDDKKSNLYIDEYKPYYQYPRNFLWEMRNNLYDKKYVDWFSDYDELGYMWIQARKNTPRTLLGWGTFEYNYE